MINKFLTATVFVLLATFSIAQNRSAEPEKIEDKDVYVFLPPNNYTLSEFAHLTKEQINQTSSLEERVSLAIQQSTKDYNALYTRDGITFQLLKYKGGKQKKYTSFVMSKKEVYFLSIPKKKYRTIDTKTIVETDLNRSFYQIAATYSSQNTSDKDFDAIIVSKGKIEYIKFK